LQLAVNIAVLASIYALICCGYVLIYRVSRVLSLAHGELMMLGAYGLAMTASLFAGHPLIAIAASAVLALLVGVLVYALLMWRMTGESVLAAVLATIALGILLRGLMVLVFGTQTQYPLRDLGWTNASFDVGGGARISGVGAALVLGTALAYGSLFAFLRGTRWGLRMRAVGEHPKAADTLGINVFRTRYMAVLLGGLIAGIGGAFFTIGSVGRFDEGMTAGKGFIGLAAMIFGNWTPIGSFLAGLLFGFSDAVATRLTLLGTGIPIQLMAIAPYITTMVVLAGVVGRGHAPAADGEAYDKE